MIIEKRKVQRKVKQKPIQFDFAASNYHPAPKLDNATTSKLLAVVLLVEIAIITVTILGFMGLLWE